MNGTRAYAPEAQIREGSSGSMSPSKLGNHPREVSGTTCHVAFIIAPVSALCKQSSAFAYVQPQPAALTKDFHWSGLTVALLSVLVAAKPDW